MSTTPDIRCVLFNGPPRCGKDSAAKFLCTHANFYRFKFADPLKIGVHTILALPDTSADAYENCKDEPHIDFFGATPREVYIEVAESLKRRFGKDLFGHVLLRYKQLYSFTGQTKIAAADCGFHEEIEPLLKFFGPEHILLIRVHRAGFDFRRDSRGYVKNVGCCEIDIDNNHTLEHFYGKLEGYLYYYGIELNTDTNV